VTSRLRTVAIVLIVDLGAISACTHLLPERYAVNAPLRHLIWGTGVAAASPELLRERLHTPPGFSVALHADDLAGARFLRFTSAGDLLLSQPRIGRIALLERDADGDGHPDGVRTLVGDLNQPHGLDLHDGWLYVAETDAVGRIGFDPATRATTGSYMRLVTGIPASHHWTRTVRIGADGFMYVSIGSSSNVCIEKDGRRAAIAVRRCHDAAARAAA
jgi:glucose/arabinose dehydrogenase